MTKENSHRCDELKVLGWREPDLARYVELWEYRQRWGAMNLEREDRLFLRKAENALPAIISGRASAKKSIKDKSYYRWLRFHLAAMNSYENELKLAEEKRGAWPMLLEVELRILDYYNPVLGVPDTVKAKALVPIREKLASHAATIGNVEFYDFEAALNELKSKEDTRWKNLREVEPRDHTYPVLKADGVTNFRQEAHREIHALIRSSFPSLAETDKPEPIDD